MRVAHMRDQRNAGCPEPGIVGGARNLRAEFRREFAVHGRAVHADLLEQAPVHHRHHAAAAGLAGVVGAVPGRAHETAGLAGIERSAGASSSSRSKPRRYRCAALRTSSRPRFAILDQGHVHRNSQRLFRHCEERSDEAIHDLGNGKNGLLRFARNDGECVSNPGDRNRCSSRCSCRGER